MKTSSDYILAMQKKNKWLQAADGSQIKLDVKSIRTLLADAFDKGFKAGEESKSLFDSLFGDVLGGKK